MHKATIVGGDRRGPAAAARCASWGTSRTAGGIAKLVERLARVAGGLSFCYEAGPCGYGLHRLLTELGQECSVVAPSLIPSRPATG